MKEIVRLAEGVAKRGVAVRLVVLWKHAYECPTGDLPVDYLSCAAPVRRQALLQFGGLLSRFRRYVRERFERRSGVLGVMLTHFSTFPFGWLLPRGAERLCFNQDLEWMFVPAALRGPARLFLLETSRRSFMVTSNDWVSRQYAERGIAAQAQASTWAEAFWAQQEQTGFLRVFDVVLLLRLGLVKRLDLHMELLYTLEARGFSCAVITPEREIAAQLEGRKTRVLLQPTDTEMKELYHACRIFVLLSEVEGFGLPPLEAMGLGCVPLCRDSGGVRNYLTDTLAGHLIPRDEPVSRIVERVQTLLADPAQLAALSGEVRAIFLQGLASTTAERERCFDHIAESLGASTADPAPVRFASNVDSASRSS